MKVDWDKIISEKHKPSRVSRRLAKMVGGYGFFPTKPPSGPILAGSPKDLALAATTFIGGPGTFIVGSLISGILNMATPFMGDYQSQWSSDDYAYTAADIKAAHDTFEFKRLLELRRRFPKEPWRWKQQLLAYGYEEYSNDLPAVDPIVEAAKEAAEQEADRKIVIQNEAYALLLRNEQNRQDEAARLASRNQITATQNAARVQAAQRGATSLQGEMERIKAASAASAATRAQNLQSLHALATQKNAIAAAEAQQQKAIYAQSAQTLAQQSAEVARLRAEAMANQSQVRTTPAVMARPPAVKKVKAPQVKFGGSKASGYIQKLIAMYKDGLEVFDIKKMKWASDNLRALGIMIEELDNPPAVFPMGRNGLKENREGMVERKMNYSEFLIEPTMWKGKEGAVLFKAIYDGKNMRIGKIAHNSLSGGIVNDSWTSGNPMKFTGYVDAGKTYTKYYRHKKGSDKGSIPLFTPEEYFKDKPDRLKQLDDYMKSNYFKEHLARLPKEFTAPPTASVEKKVNTADEDALIRILSAKMPELLPNFRNLRVYSRYSYRMRNFRDMIVTNPDPKKWRFFHVLSLGKDLQEVIASSDREGEVKLPEEVVELITDSILTMVPFPKDNDPNDPTVGYYLGSLFVMNKGDFEKKVAAALAKAPQ